MGIDGELEVDVLLAGRRANNARAATEAIRRELAARSMAGELALRQRLERARKSGDLPRGIRPTTFARYIITVLEGMSVQATGGATGEELLQVADMALRIWPSPQTEVKTADEGLAGLVGNS